MEETWKEFESDVDEEDEDEDLTRWSGGISSQAGRRRSEQTT